LLVRGPDRGKKSYKAVTVAAIANCCEAARTTQSRPILVSYCPKLPLPECTMRDRCRCEFLEWPDRRIGERRMTDVDGGQDATGVQRRIERERRKPQSH